jgi:hypothetical protein
MRHHVQIAASWVLGLMTGSSVVLGCLSVSVNKEDSGLRSIIFDEASVRSLLDRGPSCAFDSDRPVDGFWTPTGEDVARFERSFPSYIRSIGTPEGLGPQRRYLRQFVGIQSQGRRLIYVRLVHEDAPAAREIFNKRLVRVCDGGPWYGSLFYDVVSGDYSDLGFQSGY